jgi:hypothetical protein
VPKTRKEKLMKWCRTKAMPLGLALAAAFLIVGRAQAQVTIDFEGLPDTTPVTNQYSAQGLTLAGATAISAGISLNELEFPPKSGTNVVFDDGGPITGSFAVPVSDLEGFFTYSSPITLTAFNGATPVGSAVSSYPQNFVSSGNPPNELLQVSFAGGITNFSIVGAAGGGSFVLDDLQFTPGTLPSPSPVPEPATASLLLLGLLPLCKRIRSEH